VHLDRSTSTAGRASPPRSRASCLPGLAAGDWVMRPSLAIGLRGGFLLCACSWRFHDRLRTVVARVLRRGRAISSLTFFFFGSS
jgi:hypothetical protein